MHNVFFVEDEPMIRENIRRYLGQCGDRFHFCGEAGDGEMALSIIQEMRPDILITDIKMPFMNGLELSRHVKAMFPDIKIVIISGHDEFELAQSAIEIGVNKYLLKPVLKDKLMDALSQLAEELEQETVHESINDESFVRFIRFSNYMESLYAGKLSTTDAVAIAKQFEMDLVAKHFIVLNTRIDTDEMVSLSSIIHCISDIMETHPSTCWSFNNISHISVLIKGSDSSSLTEYAYSLAQTIKYNIRKEIGSGCTIIISSVYDRISEIPRAFQQTATLYKTFRETNKGQIFSMSDIDSLPEFDQEVITSFDSSRVIKRLQFASADEAEDIAREIEEGLDIRGKESVLYRYYVLMDVIRCSNSIIQGGNNILRYGNLQKIFKSSYSLENFSKLLHAVISDTISLRENKSAASRHFSVIQKACDYIHSQYQSPDLSLKMVAGYVAFSPTHFSTVFSQQMGKTFIDYLTEIRMEKAKELLISTDEKLTNIAFKIGYNEPNYFSYLFKKREGMPPKEYRRLKCSKNL